MGNSCCIALVARGQVKHFRPGERTHMGSLKAASLYRTTCPSQKSERLALITSAVRRGKCSLNRRVARLAIRSGAFARVLEKGAAEVRRTGKAELLTDLFHAQRQVIEQPLGLPNLQLIEVGDDSTTKSGAKGLFCARRAHAGLACNQSKVQTIANASEQQPTNLLSGVLIGPRGLALACQSLLDLTKQGQQGAGQG